jgi:hypothetical protein
VIGHSLAFSAISLKMTDAAPVHLTMDWRKRPFGEPPVDPIYTLEPAAPVAAP